MDHPASLHLKPADLALSLNVKGSFSTSTIVENKGGPMNGQRTFQKSGFTSIKLIAVAANLAITANLLVGVVIDPTFA